MQHGVLIESGAADWRIFQQDEHGRADICLEGRYTLSRLTPPPPFRFEEVPAENPALYARVVLEDTGAEALPWQPCTLLADRRWRVTLAGVPAGGLYRIETRMEYDGWDGYSVTRGDMAHHLGVGDIFVVAGQSNACGRAKTPAFDPPELGVHLLRASGRWDLASHPLNETTGAEHAGHFENHNPGHSPFLHFAKLLRRQLGHPVGLVVTAHGGTPFSWWNPPENGALTENMLHILRCHGIRPRAMLWYQGEAEGYEDGSADYLQRFTGFVAHCREALGQPALPILTVQLNRCLNERSEALDRHWGRMRQAQRDAMASIPGVSTVPANDLPLYDTAHLSPEGNLALGQRLANAALANVYGRDAAWQAPELLSAVRVDKDAVLVTFAPIHNRLDVYGVPPEWLPIEAEDGAGLNQVREYALERDALRLTFRRPLGPGARLHGMWRMNPGPAIPQDLGGLPVLSFYNHPIKEAERDHA